MPVVFYDNFSTKHELAHLNHKYAMNHTCKITATITTNSRVLSSKYSHLCLQFKTVVTDLF